MGEKDPPSPSSTKDRPRIRFVDPNLLPTIKFTDGSKIQADMGINGANLHYSRIKDPKAPFKPHPLNGREVHEAPPGFCKKDEKVVMPTGEGTLILLDCNSGAGTVTYETIPGAQGPSQKGKRNYPKP
jgi:hypothetical protein